MSPKGDFSAEIPPKLPNNVFEVEEILDVKIVKKTKFYLVHWKGFGPTDDSWEPEKNMDCPEAIQAFWNKRKQESQPPTKRAKSLTPPLPLPPVNRVISRRGFAPASIEIKCEKSGVHRAQEDGFLKRIIPPTSISLKSESLQQSFASPENVSPQLSSLDNVKDCVSTSAPVVNVPSTNTETTTNIAEEIFLEFSCQQPIVSFVTSEVVAQKCQLKKKKSVRFNSEIQYFNIPLNSGNDVDEVNYEQRIEKVSQLFKLPSSQSNFKLPKLYNTFWSHFLRRLQVTQNQKDFYDCGKYAFGNKFTKDSIFHCFFIHHEKAFAGRNPKPATILELVQFFDSEDPCITHEYNAEFRNIIQHRRLLVRDFLVDESILLDSLPESTYDNLWDLSYILGADFIPTIIEGKTYSVLDDYEGFEKSVEPGPRPQCWKDIKLHHILKSVNSFYLDPRKVDDLSPATTVRCRQCSRRFIINDDTVKYIFCILQYKTYCFSLIKLNDGENQVFIVDAEYIFNKCPKVYAAYCTAVECHFDTFYQISRAIIAQEEVVKNVVDFTPLKDKVKAGEPIAEMTELPQGIITSLHEVSKLFLLCIQCLVLQCMATMMNLNDIHNIVMKFFEERSSLYRTVRREQVEQLLEIVFFTLLPESTDQFVDEENCDIFELDDLDQPFESLDVVHIPVVAKYIDKEVPTVANIDLLEN